MKSKVELYNGTYKNYAEELYGEIRRETYGEDIGQNSWLTADEYREFFRIMDLGPGKKVLEIATGSGGPAVFMVKETGCVLTGIDINENGVNNARRLAEENGLSDQITFVLGDATATLPFPDGSFDAIVSIDSINHLKDRAGVLKQFYRLLKPGGKLLYTDPVVVTGIVTNEELAIRSSIGYFLFVPVGENERLLAEAGFQHIVSKDVTDNIASTSINWYKARDSRKAALLQIEEPANYEGLQSFAKMVHTLTSEKRLSRILFSATR
jgi:cyclopropane fatty-acyl-phospholipid synthase-like methyltransferase